MEYATEWPLTRASLRERGEGDDDRRPPTSTAFIRLRDNKRRVPAAIAKHGRKAWSYRVDSLGSHTFARSSRVVASRAYHKMHEIFESCALSFPSRSLHLCEAPGGFIQWLGDSHPSPDAWTWTAVSLETGPRFQTHLLPMRSGTLIQGDVSLTDTLCELILPASFDLVTADGAVEMNHDDLEGEHVDLLWSQTRLALHALAKGGTFVIKFFEGGVHESELHIARMTTLFRRVSVMKPLTSRATNSERYLVCRHYERSGNDETRNDILVASVGWLEDTRKILDRLASDQSKKLESVLTRLEQYG